ncbi:hypothetical protein JCM14076_05350 [Methylosoma difficile]
MEMLYNPDVMSANEFKATFVGREDLLRELVDLVHSQPEGAGVQHAIVIAPRGMGKTSLLQRLYFAILESELADTWLPLKYPEELYGVADLADFWLETLRLLAVEIHDPALSEQVKTLPFRFKQRRDIAEAAFALLKDVRQRSGKRLLLLVENLDQLFETLSDEQDNARLREVLMNDGTVMLVGSAVKYFKQARSYDQPLYNFFKTFDLNPLSFEQTQALLLRRAEEDGIAHFADTLQANIVRQRVLYHFTQGIPRLVLMLYRVLMESDVSAVRQALEKLLDEVTPYYKARIEVLPPQPRKLVDFIARAAAKTHEGVSPTALAAEVQLPVNQVNSQLKRLTEAGYLRSVPLRGRAACYVLSEPLYSLWHQMRLNPETRNRKLAWLVDFLYQWYDDRERVEKAERLFKSFQEHERNNDGPHSLAMLDHVQLLALSALSTEVAGQVLRISTRTFLRARDKHFDMDNKDSLLAELRANIEAVLARNPNDAGGWVAKGDLLVWEDKAYETALDCYDQALAIAPNDGSVWGKRGTALYFLGRYEEAILAYQHALEINPNDSVQWSNYGITLKQLGRNMEAMDAYNRALEIDPENELATSNQASLFNLFEDQFLEAVDGNQLESARQIWGSLCKPTAVEALARIRKRCLIFAARRRLWAFTRELIESASLGEELFPLDRAVEYLQSGDENLLEKLTLEVKDIVQMFVDDLRQTEDDHNQKGNHWLVTAKIWEFDGYIAKRGNLIHKLKAKDTTGRWAYYFVLVMVNMEQEFLKAIEGDGTLDLEDYGRVVASCYGEKPSDEIKLYLKDKFGFDV